MHPFDGREAVLAARVGSWNYRLNDECSDEDFKFFVLPILDDLYANKMYHTSIVGAKIDYSAHDVRKIRDLLFKANIAYLEVFESDQLEYDAFEHPEMHAIVGMKKDIYKMNLPYLYTACMGQHFGKIDRLNKATEGTEHLLQLYGYNTKEALHAYRNVDFLVRFAETGFRDFRKALKYASGEYSEMIGIKHGRLTRQEFLEKSAKRKSEAERYQSLYYDQPILHEVKEKIDSLIKQLVNRSVVKNTL